MVDQINTPMKIALFAVMGAMIAVPIPGVGPVIGGLLGAGLGYFMPNKRANGADQLVDPVEVRTPRTQRSGVGRSGLVIVLLGVCFLVYSMAMDTSVSTGLGRVNNIGLMRDQQNFLFIAGVAIVVGVLMLIFGKDKQSTDPFENAAETRLLERQRYAVTLGIDRVDGQYVWQGSRFRNLESAIDFVETNRAGTSEPSLS